ncbi:hypothetical protein RQP46_003048 [Phenoliferia psychrophenolica]
MSLATHHSAGLASPPLASPLRQLNAAAAGPLPTKFASSWTQLTTNPTLFAGQTPAASARFFQDLFCLRVNAHVLVEHLDQLELDDLVDKYRNNVTQLFTNAVKVLKESDKSDTRRDNVVETLIPFLRNVLARRYSNFSFDVMTLLAGSLERSDSVFTDLVSSIDLILQETSYPTELRHRTLQLAVVLVTSINQGSVNAFFLRRDLFSTLVKFMSDPATSPFAFESALLLGLLANFRKYEARNPYLVRIEDFVDEVVMRRIIGVVTAICTQTRQVYTAITDDEPPSFIASLTSLVYSLRLTELLSGGFSLSLPPAPGSTISSNSNGKGPEATPLLSSDGKESGAGHENGNGNGNGNGNEEGSANGAPTKEAPNDVESRRPSIADLAPGPPSSKKRDEKKDESAFRLMPAEVIVILLPFYDLLNSNKAFCGLVFNETLDGAPPPLPPALISLSSYVLCHAAVSARARAYSRLCLILLTILVEEGEGKLATEGVQIRLCRQRQPMLPHNNTRRPPIAAMLDTAVIYLRHNLHKRLDVETYMVCLLLVQRIMQQLKTERVRLNYDWVTLWRSILTLAGFIVSKLDELRLVSDKVDALIAQIFVVLNYAAYWGETIFPTSTTSVLLHYELLHSDIILNSLAALLTPSTSSNSDAPAALLTPPLAKAPNVRDTPSRSGFFSNGGSSHAQPLSSPSPTVALDCVANVRSIITFFTTRVDELLKASSEDESIEAEQVMRLIEQNLAKLDLVDSPAMADLRRYTESGGHEQYFRAFSKVACTDVLALIPES